MTTKPAALLREIAERALMRAQLGIDGISPSRGLGKLRPGGVIGETVQSLPPEQRALLAELRSDDIAEQGPHLINGKYYGYFYPDATLDPNLKVVFPKTSNEK